MIKVHENTIIYVACPSKVATGGPELLHQLAYKMNNLGFNAKMLYFDDFTVSKSKIISNLTRYNNPVHKFYEDYNNSYVTIRKLEDKEDNILIVPETSTGLLGIFHKVKKVIWWLSVDNYFLKQKEKKYRYKRLLFLIKSFEFNKKPNVFHLAQSYYAVDFLKRKGISDCKIGYLSDFLNKTFLDGIKFESSRNNFVLYNPKKGHDVTSKLIELLPNFTWKPIINLNPKQVKNLLLKSKVYVDFGAHPGKDRFPREAAICGCCVITGLKGSANFFDDVSISSKYKFDDPISQVNNFCETIKLCLNDYETVVRDFEEYRMKIIKEEKSFEIDILNNFLMI